MQFVSSTISVKRWFSWWRTYSQIVKNSKQEIINLNKIRFNVPILSGVEITNF